jgi:hypothetical protein
MNAFVSVDVFAMTIAIGIVCIIIAAVVAVSRPIENWRNVAVRLAVLGAVLAVGTAIVRAIATR